MSVLPCPDKLISPPNAQRVDSFLLTWDRVDADIPGYDVYVNDRMVVQTSSAYARIRNLEPDTAYTCRVRSRGRYDDHSVLSEPIQVYTSPQRQTIDIRDYGAVPDGETVCTEAIQKAIYDCPSGGTVHVPKGVFVTGALHLDSNMVLELAEGAVLRGSTHLHDYPIVPCRWQGQEQDCYSSLLNGGSLRHGGISNVAIVGEGTIDASGNALILGEKEQAVGKRGRAVCFRNSESISIQGVTICQSPAWCVHFLYCCGVTVDGVTINTRTDEFGNQFCNVHNADGLDIDSSTDVTVVDCDFETEDDGIAIKSGRGEEGRHTDKPSQNIRIKGCRFHQGFGIAFGAETAGGIVDVSVEDCTFEQTACLALLKTNRGEGGRIENVRFHDIVYRRPYYGENEWIHGPITVDCFSGEISPDTDTALSITAETPAIHDILFENIEIQNQRGRLAFLRGLPEVPLRDITFKNIKAQTRYGICGQYVDGIAISNLAARVTVGEPCEWYDCTEVSVTEGSLEHIPVPLPPKVPRFNGQRFDLLNGVLGESWYVSQGSVLDGKMWIDAGGKAHHTDLSLPALKNYALVVTGQTFRDLCECYIGLDFFDKRGEKISGNSVLISDSQISTLTARGIVPPDTNAVRIWVWQDERLRFQTTIAELAVHVWD